MPTSGPQPGDPTGGGGGALNNPASRSSWSCTECQPAVRCPSPADLALHQQGAKHRKQMARRAVAAAPTTAGGSSAPTAAGPAAGAGAGAGAGASVTASAGHGPRRLPPSAAAPPAGASNSSSARPHPPSRSPMSTSDHITKMQQMASMATGVSLESMWLDDEIRQRQQHLESGRGLSRAAMQRQQQDHRDNSIALEQEARADRGRTGFTLKQSMQSLRPVAAPGSLATMSAPGQAMSLELLRLQLDVPPPRCHIVLRTIALPARTTAVMLLCEDEQGDEERVALYNCFAADLSMASLDRHFPIGTGLLILNPWLKRSNDGWRLVRVEQPADVRYLRSESALLSAGWRGPRRHNGPNSECGSGSAAGVEQSLNALKTQGNSDFARGEWNAAIDTYSRAIAMLPASAAAHSASAPTAASAMRLALHGNRSEACLQSGRFGLALHDASLVLAADPGQVKGVRRRLRALLGLERFDEMKMDSNCAASEQTDLLADVPRLLREQRGEWRMDELIAESHAVASALPDAALVQATEHDAACVRLGAHATFVHPHIRIGAKVPSAVGGRGVVALASGDDSASAETVAVPAHTFVLSEKAIDIWHGRDGATSMQASVRADFLVELQHQIWLKTALLMRCASHPQLARALSLLDAGPAFQQQRDLLLAAHPDAVPPLSRLLADDPEGTDLAGPSSASVSAPSAPVVTLDPEQASALIRRHAFTFGAQGEEPRPPSRSSTNSPESDSSGDDSSAVTGAVSCGLWFGASWFNHSCRPNCVVSVVGDQLLIRTLRAVRPGEELTLSFLNPIHPDRPTTFRQRQEQLARMGIQCSCGWCEVFQLHPELEATETELIEKVERLRAETKQLLPQLAGANVSLRADLSKKLQRICDACAQLCVSFRHKVTSVCPDTCGRGHRHPPEGAAACLLSQLAQPLIMQSFILSRLHLGDSSVGASSPDALKRRGEWRRRQLLLCQDAAAVLAHVVGDGSSLCTLISMEPLQWGSHGDKADSVDSDTAKHLDQQRAEIAQRYLSFYGVPMPRIGVKPPPTAKPAAAKGKFNNKGRANGRGAGAAAAPPAYTLPSFLRDPSDIVSSATSAPPTSSAASAAAGAATAAHPWMVQAAAQLQTAFSLLHEPLRSYLLLQPSNESVASRMKEVRKLDVADCLKQLSRHPDGGLAKLAKEAVKLRNQLAHQSLDSAAGRRGLQLLHRLAESLSADDEAALIKAMLPTVQSASKMQQLAHEALSAAARFTKIGQYTEGSIELTRVLSMAQLSQLSATERAALYLARGRANATLKRWQVAREDAEQATLLCPQDSDASVLLVEALQQLKLIAAALGECRRALALSPHHHQLLLLERQCGARLSTQSTDWHSSKLPAPDAPTIHDLYDTMRRMIEEHAALTPPPSDVRTIGLAEFLAPRFMEREQQKSSLITRAHFLRDGTGGCLQNQAAAREAYEQAARLGSAEGLYMSGVMHAAGMGGDVDLSKALDCWRAAITQKPWMSYELPADAKKDIPFEFPNLLVNIGVRDSENAIGNSFRDGRGVDKDLQTAAEWYVRAASHGDAAGMNNLGYTLLNGHGLPADQAAARVWFKRAADSREPAPTEAMLNYAELCEFGVGGERDLDEALAYYKKAAARGQPGAAEHVQRILRSTHPAAGAPAAPLLNPQLADTWFLLATNCHHGAGECAGVIDLEQAASHYRKAAEMKHLMAPAALAQLLEDELRRAPEAVAAWLRAAEDGHPVAYWRLARCYAYGHGTARNEAQAATWQRRFDASLSNPDSWRRFGLQQSGSWPTADIQKGRELCEWESRQQLSVTELTYQQRVQRHALGQLDETDIIDKAPVRDMMDQVFAMKNAPPLRLGNSTSRGDIEDWWPLMEQRAAAGSKAAKAVLRCHRIHAAAANQLMQFLEREATESHGQSRVNDDSASEHPFAQLPSATLHSVLAQLHLAHRAYDLPLLIGRQMPLFTLLAEESLQRDATDVNGLLWLARHFQGSGEERVARWQHVVHLHPRNASAHYHLACCFGFGAHPDWPALVRHLRLAIELDGGAHQCVPSWHYDLAGGMRNLIEGGGEDKEERASAIDSQSHLVRASIAQYELYLSAVGVDDRKVPEAHYCAGVLFLLIREQALALQQWHKGQAAERARLPCLHPVGEEFPPKRLLQMMVRAVSSSTSQKSPSSIRMQAAAPPGSVCSFCEFGGPLPLRRCCGAVVYCDAQCQKRDRKRHQQHCTRTSSTSQQ